DRAKRQRARTDQYQETVQAQTDTSIEGLQPVEAIQRETKIIQLETALGTLKNEQRICVELFYLQHKSYQEVSEETGFSLKQVKSYIQNGKRNLKIRIENLEQLESTNE
ncbi:MAG: sigma factor-like helix-turn-helix DNA-binding protein, partial [Bacteroidota bacterium]